MATSGHHPLFSPANALKMMAQRSIRRLDVYSAYATLIGMESESFERGLRAFSRRVPFRSFTVELSSGHRITVDHPEALVYRGGLAVYLAPDGTPTLFDHDGVTQMLGTPDNQAATA